MKQTLEPMTPRILEPFTVILFFGLFLLTLHPSITAGDSGEITAAAFSLGIPHPSGYPLYVIVSKFLALSLPFGSIAYRVNIVSALCGALSCWMVYLITLRLVRNTVALPFMGNVHSLGINPNATNIYCSAPVYRGRNIVALSSGVNPDATASTFQRFNDSPFIPALIASFSLSLSYEFWYRSTVAEVYTLNTFLVLMMIYILLVWRDTVALLFMGNVHSLGVNPNATAGLRLSFTDSTIHRFNNSRLLYLASFLLGLGIGNHHTIVLVIPGVIVFVLLNTVALPFMGNVHSLRVNPNATAGLRPSRLTSHLSRLTFFFLLGLSIYLYLPIRSLQNPFMDWGNPQNLRNFVDVFTRRTYLPEEVGRDWGMLINQFKTFNPVHEFTVIGSAFGLIGVWGIWRWDKSAAAMILLILISTGYGLIFLAGPSEADLLKKFYLPAYAVFSIMIGVGMACLLGGQGVKGSRGQGVLSRILEPSNPRTLVVLSLSIASLIWQFSVHYQRTRNSQNYLAYDYGMNELNSLKDGAVYISKGEIKTFPLWYLQGVERYREDAKVITAYFLTQRWHVGETLVLVGGLHGKPGLTYKQSLVDAIYGKNAERGVYAGFLDEEYIPKGINTYTQGITFQLYTKPQERTDQDVWARYQLRGIGRMEEGMDMGLKDIMEDYASSHYNTGIDYYEKGDRDRAMSEFEKALAINPDNPDYLHNLAALYAEKGIRLEEAEEAARRAFSLYTGKEDKEMARETMEEILKKTGVEGPRGRVKALAPLNP